jgi:hypothetical protein
MHSVSTYLKIFLLFSIVGGAAIYLFTGSTNEQAAQEKYEQTFNDDYRVYALQIPSQLSFAGEEIPIELIDAREKLDRELLRNTYRQYHTM